MRIGLCGTDCTGKTATAELLAKTLKYTLIEEGVREYLEEKGFKKVSGMPYNLIWDMQKKLLKEKKIREKSNYSFVADRTTIDNAVYAIVYGEKLSGSELSEYVTDCVVHARDCYDLIIYFREGRISYVDDGVRGSNMDFVKKIDKYLFRYLSLFIESHRFISIPSFGLEDSVKFILDVVKGM